MRRCIARFLLVAACVILPQAARGEGVADLESAVADVERAFAATMAARDFDAFRGFLSDEAIFLGGDGVARRGREAVAEHWRRHFEAVEAPFSWRPETVVVLDSGGLALSTGPVFDRAGARVSTYTSTWRRAPSGDWRIVFDKGDRYCDAD